MPEEHIPSLLNTASLADWATLATAIITAVAVISAWIGVTKNINNSRDVAKKSQTLNMILGGEISTMHEKAIAVLKAHPSDGDQSIARLAVDKTKLTEKDRKDADALYELLNWYEYLSVGIRHDILSEEILRNSSYSTMNYLWEDSKLFIEGVRNRVKKKTFCEAFEWLIRRWEGCGYNGQLPPIDSR